MRTARGPRVPAGDAHCAVRPRRRPEALSALLAELQARGIGEVATLGPGQMLLILPAGAHGVFVPRPAANEGGVAPFGLSVIRAAELFAWRLHELWEARLCGGGPRAKAWAEPFALTAAEAATEAGRLRAFEQKQQAVCDELGLARHEWFALARQLWASRWEAEAEAEAEVWAEAEGNPSQ